MAIAKIHTLIVMIAKIKLNLCLRIDKIILFVLEEEKVI